MTFNGDKFEVIRYWPDPVIASAFKEGHHYNDVDGNSIKEKESLRDL